MECGEKFTQASSKLLNELSEEFKDMRSPVPLFAIIVLPLLVLLNPFPLEAQTLQGQFDWSTSFQVLTIPGGYQTVTLTGVATFTYNAATNQGTIFNLPGLGDPYDDTDYTFGTYYSLSNTPQGADYPLPATSFSEMTTYQNVIVNNQPATTFWIISPAFPGSLGPNPPTIAEFSGGYIEDGVFALNPAYSEIIGDEPPPAPLTGTYDNLVQTVPEPGVVPLILAGASVLMVFGAKQMCCKSFA
jgi:hypothetical protein